MTTMWYIKASLSPHPPPAPSLYTHTWATYSRGVVPLVGSSSILHLFFFFYEIFFTSSKKNVGREREKKFWGKERVCVLDQPMHIWSRGSSSPSREGGREKKRWGSVCVCVLGEGGFKLRTVGERREGELPRRRRVQRPLTVCGCGFERSESLTVCGQQGHPSVVCNPLLHPRLFEITFFHLTYTNVNLNRVFG